MKEAATAWEGGCNPMWCDQTSFAVYEKRVTGEARAASNHLLAARVCACSLYIAHVHTSYGYGVYCLR